MNKLFYKFYTVTLKIMFLSTWNLRSLTACLKQFEFFLNVVVCRRGCCCWFAVVVATYEFSLPRSKFCRVRQVQRLSDGPLFYSDVALLSVVVFRVMLVKILLFAEH